MTKKICGYCGVELTKSNTDKEHVFPKCLYPKSKRNSKVQRITIPSCNSCNNGWSDDEAHFRNVLMIAGDNPNSSRQEIWNGSVLRSFDKSDGAKRLIDLHQLMKPRNIDGQERYVVFPAEDDRVLRVVRKIVRGLCYYHQVPYRNSISDDQVWVDILKCKFPQEYWEMLEHHYREPDIAKYRYKVLNEDDIHSVWVISFYNSVDFIGIVSQTP